MSPDMRKSPIDSPGSREGAEARQCRSCRAVGYPEDIYCARCGLLLSPACQGCVAAVSHPVAFYCVHCGRKLQDRSKTIQ